MAGDLCRNPLHTRHTGVGTQYEGCTRERHGGQDDGWRDGSQSFAPHIRTLSFASEVHEHLQPLLRSTPVLSEKHIDRLLRLLRRGRHPCSEIRQCGNTECLSRISTRVLSGEAGGWHAVQGFGLGSCKLRGKNRKWKMIYQNRV